MTATCAVKMMIHKVRSEAGSMGGKPTYTVHPGFVLFRVDKTVFGE